MKKTISQQGLSPIFMLVMLAFLLSSCGDDASVERYRFNLSGLTMGTSFLIKASQLPEGVKVDRLERLIQQRLDEINQRMSTYISDSEVSLINISNHTGATFISPELAMVLAQAHEISTLSKGAFDITVAPIVNLWGFGADKMINQVPHQAKDIEQLLQFVGYQKIAVNAHTMSFSKSIAGVSIDLSALAKGYAVDEIAKVLEKQGMTNYMVEIGGELYLKGKNQQGENWRIAIEKPNAEKFGLRQAVIVITDIAMATSGDYRNYFEQDGQRFSHIIDPRTGYPVSHRLASVTVLSDTAMKADAWATALMVLGQDKGYHIAEQQNLAVLFIIKTDQGFVERATPLFSAQTKLDR